MGALCTLLSRVVAMGILSTFVFFFAHQNATRAEVWESFHTNSDSQTSLDWLDTQGRLSTQANLPALSALEAFSTADEWESDEDQSAYWVFTPTITDDTNITYPSESYAYCVDIFAQNHASFRVGGYKVYLLAGNCVIEQGDTQLKAERMVLWVGDEELDENLSPTRCVLVYLEGRAEATFVSSKTTSRIRDNVWVGKLTTNNQVRTFFEGEQPTQNKAALETNALYLRAKERVFYPAQVVLTQLSNGAPNAAQPNAAQLGTAPLPAPREGGRSVLDSSASGAQGVVIPNGNLYSETGEPYPTDFPRAPYLAPGDATALDPNLTAPGRERIGFFQRNDVPLQMTFRDDPETGQSIAIFDGGVSILIEGAERHIQDIKNIPNLQNLNVGTIDIAADRIVAWSNADLSQLATQMDSIDLANIQLELYLEGNIIFRQGDREIYADRMYFDVKSKRGIIREAEIFASLPNVEGLIRLRAEEVRMPEEGVLTATDAFVTTSRIGEPLYRFQMNRIMLRSQRRTKVDPVSGAPVLDPRTGKPVKEGPNDIVGYGTVVKVGNFPIFYLPYFAAPMEAPTQIINKFSLRNDNIFGFQAMVGVDAYRLFGIQEPWKGTDWDLDFFYYSKRGPGFGSEFRYNRTAPGEEIPLGLFSGPGEGWLDFWGIYDTGYDNLGFERRRVKPETEWRYQLIGRHKSIFGNDWEIRAQLGLISDRNFQEEYFQNSWYTEPDRATQLEIRKTEENRSYNIWSDIRVNDFHNQTQRTPQAEFYWIGEPLLDDLLTWSSYSQMGYVHAFPDTEPEAPEDRALWSPLDWEANRQGVRASTRHEISYPFQAGAVKIVPYALGEAAYWGEDMSGEDTSRLYGQAGVRASLPMWQTYDVKSKLFNLNGIMHKVEFDAEASVSGANISAEELPLYDLLDDRAIIDFRHHMSNAIFGGAGIPWKFDPRSYAIRSNLGGWVTSPSTEMADDLALIRVGMHHRWQTKRGMPGQQRIVDWVTLDMNMNLYPDADRDNFGSLVGLLDYDLRWHPGDRVTIYSTGCFDFFSDGLRMVDVGGILDRPGKGSIFGSIHYLTGPVENVVMRLGFNYRMSEKWTSSFVSTFDISGKGNIGEAVSITRVGESFLFTLGATYDNPSDNFGIHFAIEPRFGKKGNNAQLFNIAPPGVEGVE
ncbi:MAG: LPS assembly protein LptD [Planctomycetia bacterium]|nr:LPS assembly protein LptD [Planctomycetia bacterium]